MPKPLRPLPILIAACAVAACAVPAQRTTEWPRFLGPGGSARAEGAATLDFDRKRDLVYRVEVPRGAASPCISGDRIFLTGTADDRIVMFALDRKTGRELWRHGVPAPEGMSYLHSDADVALPTACAGGDRVYFHVASYGLVARGFDGQLAWEKRLPAGKASYGVGSSPMLCDGKVILLRDGRPDAKLYAFDAKTGREVWSVSRKGFFDSHTTPYLWENRQRRELIIASTGRVMSFDPATGDLLWQVTGLTPLVCTSPTGDRERLYFGGWSTPAAAHADRVTDGLGGQIEFSEEELADPAAMFKRLDPDGDGKITRAEALGRIRAAFATLDGNQDGALSLAEWLRVVRQPQLGKNVLVAIRCGGKGNATRSHVAWTVRRNIPYVSSPLLYRGRIYLVKAGGIVSCLDAESGRPVVRRGRLDDHAEYYATPIGVDGHLLICSSSGTLYVLDVADGLKEVRRVPFDERIFATPAVVDGTVYVRTMKALYAFGRKQ